MKRYANPDNDKRGPWRQGADGTAKSGGEDARWPITLPSGRVVQPPKGRYWAFSKDTFQKAKEEGRVWFGKKGDSLPVIKTYLASAKEGTVPVSWWPATEAGSNQEAKRDHLKKLLPDIEPFDTPKPERLLERIMTIATKPGDTVLDCFAGSGTTAAVALKLGRQWVTVEQSSDTVREHIIPRLRKVTEGKDPFGITSRTRQVLVGDLPDGVDDEVVRKAAGVLKPLHDHGVFDGVPGLDAKTVQALASALRKAAKTETVSEVKWAGGGGFRHLKVGPSMFEEIGGFVVLADWVTAGQLAEGVAAQLGYSFEPDGPFAGRKGRSRLAVIDGVLTPEIARFVIGHLGESEQTLIVAQAVEPGCDDLVRELRRGSKVRKVPRDLARVGTRTGTVVELNGGETRDSADDASEGSEENGS